MFYCEGFQLNEVKLGTPEREDRTLLVFAWTSYGINVGGWASERVQKERNWRANTVQDQGTRALWRLGNGELQVGDVVWRTLWRTPADFRYRIPSANRIAALWSSPSRSPFSVFRQTSSIGAKRMRFFDSAAHLGYGLSGNRFASSVPGLAILSVAPCERKNSGSTTAEPSYGSRIRALLFNN